MSAAQHRITLSSPRYATRTETLRTTTDLARTHAATLLLAAPGDSSHRAIVYRRGRSGFELVCILRVATGRDVEVSE